MNVLHSKPCVSLGGCLTVPGDKSISHRALIFSALAKGESQITNFLPSDDCLATASALCSMGVVIDSATPSKIIVRGVGMHGLHTANQVLNLGNSGTAMRLLSGLLSAQKFGSELTGDDSLNSRPMNRIKEPLQMMGADVRLSEKGTAPILISPVSELKGIDYSMPTASAQVKSCILLAGLYAKGTTTISEPAVSRDHSERMLRTFGYPLQSDTQSNINKLTLDGGGELIAADVEIPCDISSAMFFIVAACIIKNSDVTFKNVGINPTRMGAINILKRMQADIDISNVRNFNNEPVADIRARSSQLKGVDVTPPEVSSAIDEFPILFIAAACAKGQTTIKGAQELRVKESDRIAVMEEGLKNCGVEIETFEDGAVICGGDMQGATINAYGDHRIAMSFAVAGATASGSITIENCAAIRTSFPDFCDCARQIGLQITEG